MHAHLAHRVLRNARIQAFRGYIPPPNKAFLGGLVLGKANDSLRHRRNAAPWDGFDPDAHYRRRVRGSFVYGGLVQRHFGHFMSEMVHRILPARLLDHRGPWIFVTFEGDRRWVVFEKLPPFARDILEFLEVKAGEFRGISADCIVDELFVVEQGSELRLGPKPGYLDDLHEYTTPRLDAIHGAELRPKKVYVSRAALPGGTFLGEAYLEDQLTGEGFAIIRPESLPVLVQMDIYRKAEVLVFNAGSACHGVELLGSGALQRCYLIDRGIQRKAVESALVPRAREFAVSVGHPYLGTLLTARRSRAPVPRLGMNLFDVQALLAFFRDHGIARLPSFDRKQYLNAASMHLQGHIDAARASGLICDEAEIKSFFTAFEAAAATQEC
ncbi:MAG: hypothetical protein A3G24_03670 [Betaproteobacteria bacterium RIFCSPLOWO2_12_FULL_62_13]|nr:MAG: hypothetical protein A3G24_03670 [Betaproteobacteria bacterium RIFCSPLOWO2_12_FULL_62_13]